MEKNPIGIIDMNINNISILNRLVKDYKYENFIYIADKEFNDYEVLPEDKIRARVKTNLAYLLDCKVKLIVVVSNTIVEYCKDMFDDIKVPVINIVDTIVNYINSNYEHKNMLLLASENIIKANIYQKNFRYNHLYNISCNKMDDIILEGKQKTSKSFTVAKELFKSLTKKDVDIIIPTHVNLVEMKTEVFEFVKEADLLYIQDLLSEKIKAALLTIENIYNKGKGIVELNINPELHKSYKNVINIKHFLKGKEKKLKGIKSWKKEN